MPHILFLACLASDEVNQVGTLARNVVFARLSFTCGCAGEMVLFDNDWAKHALEVGAFVFLGCVDKSVGERLGGSQWCGMCG